jgi:hypothetical protein
MADVDADDGAERERIREHYRAGCSRAWLQSAPRPATLKSALFVR